MKKSSQKLNIQPKHKFIGGIALGLGIIGSVISIILAIALLWYGINAVTKLSQVRSSLDDRTQRLQQRLTDFDSKVKNAKSIEQLDRLSEETSASLTSISRAAEGISDNRIYQNLPVETDAIDSLLNKTQDSANRLNTLIEIAPSMSEKALKKQLLSISKNLRNDISGTKDKIEETVNKLKLWLKVVIISGLLLAFWSIWAQYVLFRSGLTRFKKSS